MNEIKTKEGPDLGPNEKQRAEVEYTAVNLDQDANAQVSGPKPVKPPKETVSNAIIPDSFAASASFSTAANLGQKEVAKGVHRMGSWLQRMRCKNRTWCTNERYPKKKDGFRAFLVCMAGALAYAVVCLSLFLCWQQGNS